MMTIKVRAILLTWLCIFLCANFAPAQHLHRVDKPAVHGMVIFGNEKIYAYHLPMFHAPHNFQVVFELKLDAQTLATFKRDQQLNTEHATYTLEPEKFVLPEMIKNPRPFKANIYRGHFERGGAEIISDVTVDISDILYFSPLNSETEHGETLQYIIIGNAKEQYAMHVLTNKPDFDQLIQISLDLSALNGAKYVMVKFPALPNVPLGVSGNAVNAFLIDRPVKMILLRQLYLEFADLRDEE